MDSRSPHLTRGYVIALVSAVFLSTTAIFIRYLTQTYAIPALVLAFWRDVFVSLGLLLVLAFSRSRVLRVESRNLFFLIIYGFILAVFNSLWTLSVALNGAAVATVLAYCSAAFTALLGWWFLHEELGWGKVLAVLISLSGCVLVSGALNPAAWRLNLIGILSGVLAGLLYAVYSLMGRRASQRGLNPWTTGGYVFGIASIFLLFFNLIPGGFLPGAAKNPADLLWLGTEWIGWGVLVVLSIGPTVLGFGLYLVALGMLPASVVNLVATSEPVFTALIAYFLLGEQLGWVQIVGSLLVLGGVVFLRIYEGWLAGGAMAKEASA